MPPDPPIATLPRNTSVTSLGSVSSDDSSTMSDSVPKYDIEDMMKIQSKEATKVLSAATRDEYEKFRRNMGACFTKIPLEMDETKDASFLVDDETKWNARHGTVGITLPAFPKHPGIETSGLTRYERTKLKRETTVHTTCKYLCTQGLDFMDKVFPGQFNTVKEDGAFKLNYTLQDAFDHLAKTLHFEVTTKYKYPTLLTELDAPYDVVAGPGPYFLKLIDTQAAIQSFGPIYAATANDAVLVLKGLTAFRKAYGEDALLPSTKDWDKIDARLQLTPNQYQATIFNEFQTFWMKELQRLRHIQGGGQVQVNLAEVTEDHELTNARVNHHAQTIAALQAELAELRQIQQQAPAPIPDDLQTVLSNLTTVTTKLAAGTVTTAPITVATPSVRSSYQAKRVARWENIKKMNGGRGRLYNQYCWHCGLTPNHTAAGCNSLTPEQKEKYKAATLHNRMGGSMKYLERAGKYESDFDFKM